MFPEGNRKDSKLKEVFLKGNKSNMKYKLLEDSPIDITEEGQDLLNNQQYVDMLTEMIQEEAKDDNVETVALVGSWGSGKSSIINAVCEEIRKRKINNREPRIETYNAWKYSKDDFRKSFLIDAEEDKKAKELLENELYKEVTTSQFTLRSSKLLIAIMGLVIMFLLIIGLRTSFEHLLEYIYAGLSLLGISLAAAVAYAIKALVSNEQTKIVKSFSSHDFSERFKQVIDKSKKFNVFVIDDLDRCRPEQAIDILEIIHSYLKEDSNGNYIFVVPIDQERLTFFLCNERGYDIATAKQYFNKLFDLTIEMQNPGRTNLYGMLKDINNTYDYELSPVALNIIADYLVDTPRDIKKHINNINMQRMMLEERRDETGELALSDDQLVKIYAIKNKWPKVYQILIDNYNLYDDINKEVYRLANELTADGNKLNLNELKKMLLTTEAVDIKNIRYYEFSKVEDRPDTEIFNALIQDNSELLEEKIENNEWSITNIINCILYIYKVYVIERKMNSEYIWHTLSSYLWLINNYYEQCNDLIAELDLGKIFTAIHELYDVDNNEDIEREYNKEWIKNEELLKAFFSKYGAEDFVQSYIDLVVKVLNELKESQISCDLLIIDNDTQLINDKRLALLKNVIETNEYEDVVMSEVLQTGDEAAINDNIDVIINGNRPCTLLAISNIAPAMLDGKSEEIMQGLELESLLRQNPGNWNSADQSHFESTVDFIISIDPSLREEVGNVLNRLIVENSGAVRQFIMNANNMTEEDRCRQIVQRIMQIISRADESISNLLRIYDFTAEFCKRPAFIEMPGIIANTILKDDLRASWILSMLGLYKFNDSVCELFFNEIKTNTYLKENTQEIVDVIKKKTDSSITINAVGEIRFSYSDIINNFISKSEGFPKDLFEDVFEVIGIEEIIGHEELLNIVKDGDQALKKSTIAKLTNYDQCLVLFDAIPHNEYKAEYHKIIRPIIENAEDVTLLSRIHSSDNTDADELRWIKQKILNDFPNADKGDFKSINWNG